MCQVLLFIYVSNTLADSIEDTEKKLRHGPDYPYSDLKMELNTSGMAGLLLGCWLQKERESRRERGREKGGEWEGERCVKRLGEEAEAQMVMSFQRMIAQAGIQSDDTVESLCKENQ